MTHLTGARSDWAGPLQINAIGIAAALLAGALGYSRLMPREAVAPAPGDREPAIAAIVPVLLVVLAALTVLQAPAIAAWWTTDRGLLQEALGTGRDPMDLRIIPTVILLSLPALAAIALAAFVLTSAAGMLARADQRFRVLSACALLLTGLVAGERLILHAGGALGGTVRALVEQSSDQKAIAQVSGWLARHDAPAADVNSRLIWLWGGYVLAATVALAELKMRRVSGN